MSLYSPIIRGFVFGLSFLLTISIGIGGMVYAANSGGKFGEMLNRILTGNPSGVSGRTWENDTTGTVYNAENFSGMTVDKFVKVRANQDTCKVQNKCIVGFQADGTVICNN